jgi:hypothetical protein
MTIKQGGHCICLQTLENMIKQILLEKVVWEVLSSEQPAFYKMGTIITCTLESLEFNEIVYIEIPAPYKTVVLKQYNFQCSRHNAK